MNQKSNLYTFLARNLFLRNILFIIFIIIGTSCFFYQNSQNFYLHSLPIILVNLFSFFINYKYFRHSFRSFKTFNSQFDFKLKDYAKTFFHSEYQNLKNDSTTKPSLIWFYSSPNDNKAFKFTYILNNEEVNISFNFDHTFNIESEKFNTFFKDFNFNKDDIFNGNAISMYLMNYQN